MLQKSVLGPLGCYRSLYWGHWDATKVCTGAIGMLQKSVLGPLGCYRSLYWGHWDATKVCTGAIRMLLKECSGAILDATVD